MKKRKPYNKKRFHWKFYKVDNNTFFFQTYNKGPTIRVCPTGLTPLLQLPEPVAHTCYNVSKEGYITTYLIKSSEDKLRQTIAQNNKKPDMHKIKSDTLPCIDSVYNIFSEHINLGDLTQQFIQTIRQDIIEFCNKKHTKKIIEAEKHFTLVDKIEQIPKFTLIQPNKYNVVKDGKGQFFDICEIDIGLDISKGCVSTITPEGKYDPSRRCGYCYAFQNGPCFYDTLFDINENSVIKEINEKINELNLNERSRIYFRIGQLVEANIPSQIKNIQNFQDNLKIILKALSKLKEKYDIRVAMPTKTPEFSEESAGLFKAANVSVLASFAYRQIEPGIIGHGFPPEKRLEEILKFGKAGLNAGIYIATDITRGPEYMQDDAKLALDFFEKHKEYLNLQFLDIRITNKDHAELIGGAPWRELIYTSQRDLFYGSPGRWTKTGQNYLTARTTHPYFLEVIGNNTEKIRLCSTHVINKSEQRCGKCFMDQ